MEDLKERLNLEWNGIAMWVSLGLFITGTPYFLMSKDAIRKNEK